MSGKRPIGTISFGVFLATCGVVIAAYATKFVTWQETVPLLAILNGVWILILAAIKHASPAEYEMGAFAVGVWGAIIFGGGLFWFLGARGLWGVTYIVALAMFLVLIGILAGIAGVRAQGSHKK